jgi:hypothetical protein
VSQAADSFVGKYVESRVREEGAPIRNHGSFLHL